MRVKLFGSLSGAMILALACSLLGCVDRDSPRATPVTPSPSSPADEPQPPAADEQSSETAVEAAGAVPAPAESSLVSEPSPPEPAAAPEPQTLALVPIEIELPTPAFRGTPVPLEEPNVAKPLGKPRPPFLAPEGTTNLARGKPVVASDPDPASGEVDFVTDGDKEASDFGYLELRPGSEWVQVDLGEKAAIYAVLLWHNHAEARVYRDVVVQVSDDPDFLDSHTVFSTDYDNSSGLGIGQDLGYVETAEGKLIDCRGVEGRYVRFYSRGNHVDDKNHYTEVEVFGRPAA